MAEMSPLPFEIREITKDNSGFDPVETKEEALYETLQTAKEVDEATLSYNIVDSDGAFRGIQIDFIGSVWTDGSWDPNEKLPSQIVH